ncbi:sodium:solute symporter [Biformimicrobium ophioploci]|uniref:Sodium:solute symporter n=1 Tax=Biformimicrobium ophioploci TaxID=3036711 RepID=A0ABQ6M0P0_9GAMM|nr:sodium:solute symporter [Microbulbifer sp. NKW57]GMG87915.1 sodium:solute symporter [Microbulbifer sp. NKW57]
MQLQFAPLDWWIFGGYFALISVFAWQLSRRPSGNTRDYFLAGNAMPTWVVAVSVLATTQSAATFLGGPDMGYRGNLAYISTNIGAIIAALFVAYKLIPMFYQRNLATSYELLEHRFGEKAKQQAGFAYLFGRVFASGARLYMAAIAVSMILFGNIEPGSVIGGIAVLCAVGLGYTFVGGVRAVIWSDLIQCIVYIAAGIAVAGYLLYSIPADFSEIVAVLENPAPGEGSKLALFDTTLSLGSAHPFNLLAVFTGFVLLNIAAYGLDQDMTQRLLSCKDSSAAAKSAIGSILMVIPVMLLFMLIGSLLYVFYQRPDLMSGASGGEVVQSFSGEKITIFMYYVLNEMPAGLRGLVTAGVIAAALSTLNSGLNSMSSVLIQDFYRPLRESRGDKLPEHHYVNAGRAGMLLFALLLGGMAILCYFWQKFSDMPLLAFALSVMVFSYSGLLGVYFTALFTKRGNATSVPLALIAGFVATFAMQPYTLSSLSGIFPSLAEVDIAFPFQLCIGTLIAFGVCFAGSSCKVEDTNEACGATA